MEIKSIATKSIKEKSWMQALIINVIMLCLLLLFFYPRYENDADIVMQVMLTDGLKTGDSYAHILFSNYLFGILLSFLYTIFSRIQWYYLMLIVLSFISITIIDAIILKRNFNQSGRIIITIISAFLGCECYLLPVYVKTSAILCIAAVFIVVRNIIYRYNQLKNYLITLPLFLFSILLSTKIFIYTFLGALAAVVVYFVIKKITIKDKKHLCILGTAVLLTIIVSVIIDHIAYNNSYWGQMDEYRTSFEQIYTYGAPDYYEVQDLLPEGMTQENYNTLKQGDFLCGDEEEFDLLKEVASIHPRLSIDSFFYFTRHNPIKLFATGLFYLWVILIYGLFAFKEGNHKVFLISSVVLCLVSLAVLYYFEAFDYKWMNAIALLPALFYLFLYIEDIKYDDNRLMVAYVLVIGVILYNKFASTLRTSVPKINAPEYLADSTTYGYLDYNRFLEGFPVTSEFPNGISCENIQITNAIYGLVPAFYDSTHTKRAIENDVWISNPRGISVSAIWKGDNYDKIIIVPEDWSIYGEGEKTGTDIEIYPDSFIFGPYFPIEKGQYILSFVGENFADASVDAWSNRDQISFLDQVAIEEKPKIMVNLDRDVEDLEVRIFYNGKKHATINYCILKRCE